MAARLQTKSIHRRGAEYTESDKNYHPSGPQCSLLKIGRMASASSSRIPRWVIPAWSTGIPGLQDVSGSILAKWMPAIHAGMTKICHFPSVGVRKSESLHR